MATPLHNHSFFSTPLGNDGYSSPTEIAKRVAALGMDCCAITDHGTTAGYRDFSKAMAAEGLRPILGIESYQAKVHRLARPEGRARDGSHTILLAQNPQGLRNIMCLSDEANKTGFYYHPRIDWELLEKHHEGIIATSACMNSLICKGVQEDDLEPLNKYLNIFGDRFFIELHTYDHPDQEQLNLQLVSIAQERGIPLVYANDAHYCSEEDFDMHELLMNIRYRTEMSAHKERSHNEEDDTYYHPNCMFIMGEQDVRNRLSYLPASIVDEAVANSDLIASMCDAQLPKPGKHLPVFDTPPEYSNAEIMLIELVEEGLQRLYPEGSEHEEEAYERAESELQQIIDAGLASYFLITWDWINWAYNEGILVGVGRGSSAGCILAYAMGITHVCPIKYKLRFERFWNSGREDGLPDIDTDVPQAYRGAVKKYLAERWGADRVMSIGTIDRYHAKGALRDCGPRIYGPSSKLYSDLDAITSIIDELNDAGKDASWDRIWAERSEELAPYKADWPLMFDAAEDLDGRISGYSIHASGVVISAIDLSGVLPGRLAARKGDEEAKGKEIVTQIEMKEVEARGFPKFDVLGLRNLDTLMKTLELVPEMKGKNPNDVFRGLDLENIPVECWQLLEEKKTLGLFQVEEGGSARNIAKQLAPRSVFDLAAIVALNRPGPLRSGATERYIERHHGAVVTYPHEMLADTLAHTYGEMIYQEDVLAFFRSLGYSWIEADNIRAYMGKKMVDEMKAEYPRYLERAKEFMTEEDAKTIWDLMVDFAKYGFNMAHSVCYGVILLWCMYAKWRWPAEFIMASILTNTKKAGKYVAEGRRMGVEILPPDINNSGVGITSKNGVIYFGLVDIKNIGVATAKWVIDHGPYESYEHFLEVYAQAQEDHNILKEELKAEGKKVPRSPGQIVGSGKIEALVNAGAFDSLSPREDIDLFRVAELQEEFLGLSLVDPFEPAKLYYAEDLEELDDFQVLNSLEEGDFTDVPGVIKGIRKTKTKNGKNPGSAMAFVDFEWDHEQASAVCFPNTWNELKHVLRENTMCVMSIKGGNQGPILQDVIRLD